MSSKVSQQRRKGGSAPSTGAETPLLPVERATPEQIFPLKPVEDSTLEQVDIS